MNHLKPAQKTALKLSGLDLQNTFHELLFGGINDFGVGSESLIGKPSENEVNLSSISLGSVGSEMNNFIFRDNNAASRTCNTFVKPSSVIYKHRPCK